MLYKILFFLLRLVSRLPFCVLYCFSDLMYYIVYYVVKYRKAVVRRQLAECFPEKSEAERREIEQKFYHHFCDHMMEIVKLLTISDEEISKRMKFFGLDEVVRVMRERNKYVCSAFLGHMGNWEWLVSVPRYIPEEFKILEVYHPLENKAMDDFVMSLRTKYGGVCVPMKETYQYISNAQQRGERDILVLLSDQCPGWKSMHQWCDFLNHKTSFYLGAERIAKQYDGVVIFCDMRRPRRGYYELHISVMTADPQDYSEFEITNRYAELLEASIRRNPELWLWTHKRWKRTYEGWLKRQQQAQ